MLTAKPVADGIYFGEGPRWHDGRLWFSDFYDHAVKTLDAKGVVSTELELDDHPAGLGWLPDGRMLIVAMQGLKVLRTDDDGLHMHGDLTGIAVHLANDMGVDAQGRAYVGNFGFDLDAALTRHGPEHVLANHATTDLARVDPDGTVHAVATEMHFPNGMVITPDGRTLIVAETLRLCLTAFDIAADGSLSNRRVWAQVGMRAPDGICLDADGNVWIANALAPECVLVAPGGGILETVKTDQNCYACMLGGDDGRTLYMMTAPTSVGAVVSQSRQGRIVAARVNTGHAGRP